ncbi:hypothetical protein [Pseudomonas sp. CGJS7]|uniref:hypothetical protein n=1 Tax=Pseudomonas sp. CGJS7 TaxID=3109348 RepID=UPI003007F45D
MKSCFAAIALLWLVPVAASACRLYQSPEFQLQASQDVSAQPARVGVRKVYFAPRMSADDSCNGVGFIRVALSGLAARDIDKHGVFVRALAGVHDAGLLPTYPLALRRDHRGEVSISLAWTGITTDADGQVRWKLELVPVSRTGVLGTPVTVCAASDESCPARGNKSP